MEVGGRRDERHRDGARARRERRARAEARLRLRLVRDGAALAHHRGGPEARARDQLDARADEGRRKHQATDSEIGSLRDEMAVLKEDLRVVKENAAYEVVKLRELLHTEVSTRKADDDKFVAMLTDEVSTRKADDEKIVAMLTDEVSTRKADDKKIVAKLKVIAETLDARLVELVAKLKAIDEVKFGGLKSYVPSAPSG